MLNRTEHESDSTKGNSYPLRYSNVNSPDGFAIETAQKGDQVRIATIGAITSDEPLFHNLADSILRHISYMEEKTDVLIRLQRVNTMLIIYKADKSAVLWIDNVPLAIQSVVKRSIIAGEVVYESDIADVIEMTFPSIDFDATDKVLCLFRVDWRFGLVYDMNPRGSFDHVRFSRSLGRVFRQLRYKGLYDSLTATDTHHKLANSGWFPFAEIITVEYKELLHHIEQGYDLTDIERKLVASFDDKRLDNMIARWSSKDHFAERIEILSAAIDSFKRNEPVSVIKILLTEIEGALNSAYRKSHGGRSAKIPSLIAYAVQSAEAKSGAPDTLLFPSTFGRYLRDNTFAKYDARTHSGTVASRNTVSHGEAALETYTMSRALQVILTVDQLAFYT